MPFISPDWRSPGEVWVKFDGGWEKKRVLHIGGYDSDGSSSSLLKDRKRECRQLHKCKISKSLFESGRRRNESVSSLSSLSDDNDDETLSFDNNALPRSVPFQNSQKSITAYDFILEEDEMETDIDESEQNILVDVNSNVISDDFNFPPYCKITVKSTSEVVGFNGLAEAMIQLDFVNGVRDIRRFSYLSNILLLLVEGDRLLQLSGSVQKLVFRMVESLAYWVEQNDGNHVNVLKTLMERLTYAVAKLRVWGSNLGSQMLLHHHLRSRFRITRAIERMQKCYKQDLACYTGDLSQSSSSSAAHPMFPISLDPTPYPIHISITSFKTFSLPIHCWRDVLLHFQDPLHLKQVSNVCQTFKVLAQDRQIWRELVSSTYTWQQIKFILQTKPKLMDTTTPPLPTTTSTSAAEITREDFEQHVGDYSELYKYLRQEFGLPEVQHSETLMLCWTCRSMFWPCFGHPCKTPISRFSQVSETSSEGGRLFKITPAKFLSFFSL